MFEPIFLVLGAIVSVILLVVLAVAGFAIYSAWKVFKQDTYSKW